VRFNSPDEAQEQLDKVGGPGGTINIEGRDVKLNYAHSREQKQGKTPQCYLYSYILRKC